MPMLGAMILALVDLVRSLKSVTVLIVERVRVLRGSC